MPRFFILLAIYLGLVSHTWGFSWGQYLTISCMYLYILQSLKIVDAVCLMGINSERIHKIIVKTLWFMFMNTIAYTLGK